MASVRGVNHAPWWGLILGWLALLAGVVLFSCVIGLGMMRFAVMVGGAH
jgi:hypothetical protein